MENDEELNRLMEFVFGPENDEENYTHTYKHLESTNITNLSLN